MTRVHLDAERWAVVKQEPLRGPLGWLRVWLRRTRAQRSAAGRRALAEAGLEAPGLLDVIRRPGRLLTVWEHVPGETLQAAWSTHDRTRQAELALAAARFAARLHAAARTRDLKPANLIATVLDALVLVDLDDVLPGSSGRVERVRNLAALDAYGQCADPPLGVGARWRGLQAYCQASGLELRDLAREVLTASRAKRAAWG